MTREKEHPREGIVFEAKLKLQSCLNEIGGELTDGEMVRLVMGVAALSLEHRATRLIRMERHGSEGTPGGLLCGCDKCKEYAE